VLQERVAGAVRIRERHDKDRAGDDERANARAARESRAQKPERSAAEQDRDPGDEDDAIEAVVLDERVHEGTGDEHRHRERVGERAPAQLRASREREDGEDERPQQHTQRVERVLRQGAEDERSDFAGRASLHHCERHLDAAFEPERQAGVGDPERKEVQREPRNRREHDARPAAGVEPVPGERGGRPRAPARGPAVQS
jgi:hypothetical protein